MSTDFMKRFENLFKDVADMKRQVSGITGSPKIIGKGGSRLEIDAHTTLSGIRERIVLIEKELKFVAEGKPYEKFFPDKLNLIAGTSTSKLSDMRNLGDGDFYVLNEAAATPGFNLEVEFSSIEWFNWVSIHSSYNGTTTHTVGIQLRNYDESRWDTFDCMVTVSYNISTVDGYVIKNHSFSVPNAHTYIGNGKVRVRFYHTNGGNASHTVAIDEVALYK